MRYIPHLLAAAVAASAASPPVQVSLKSSWKAPPSLVELLETFSLEDSSLFFPLLDLLTNREVLPSTKLNPEGLHEATFEVARNGGLLEQHGSREMIEMNLAMHAATPKIEAFYNWYDTRYNASEGRKCGSWVDWYGDVVCDVESLARLAGVETIDSNIKSGIYIRPKLLTFDHIHPSSELLLERPHRTAILYASLDSRNFRELHGYLYKLSSKPNAHVEYVLRHIPPTHSAEHSSTLSGYGVGLDLKKMDYLALDDRLAKTTAARKQNSEEVQEEEVQEDSIAKLIEAYPENKTASEAQLTKEEFVAIGPQAVQLIADSNDPLETWTTLSQNFPKYAKSIPRRVVANASIVEELASNGQQVQPGMNVMWINGAMLDGKDTEPLGLLRQLRKERGVMQSLTSLGLDSEQAMELLTHANISNAQRRGGGITDGLFDASDRQEGGDLIVYWNDFNKDKRYARWNPSLYALLRPMYPGQFPSIKGNLFNVILALDLSQTSNLHFIVGPMSNILEKNIPFRFGVAPIAETEDGTKMARLFYHLVKVFGRKKTLAFLRAISQPGSTASPDAIYWPVVEETYNNFLGIELSENPDAEKVPFATILKGDDSTQSRLEKLTSYHDRLGSGLAQSKTGSAFFNGKPYVFDGQFLRYLQTDFAEFQRYYQEAVYSGALGDKDVPEIGEHFYDLPTTTKRRSLYIFPKTPVDLHLVNLPEALSKAGLVFLPGSYLYSDAEAYPLSTYVVGDFDSESGLALVKEALESLTETSNARLSFIPNPTHVNAFGPESRSALLSILARSGSLTKWSSKEAMGVLKSALGITLPASDGAQAPLSKPGAVEKISKGIDFSAENYAECLRAGRVFLKQLKIEPGQLAVIVNGRVVSPITPGTFSAGDFEALEGYELRKRTEPVAAALEEVVPALAQDKLNFADAVALASSVIAKIQQPGPSESGLFDSPPKPRHRNYNILADTYTAFEFGNNRTALYHVAAIVDPLSEDGQKWSSLFKWLANVPDVFIKVYLNPGAYTNLPLKRYYRYNLVPKLTYDVEGQEVSSKVVFQDLPVDPIYTLAMDVPSSWLVRPRESLYDLDNIQLGQLLPQDDSVKAIFSLDALILDGHAREAATQAPPRGVQLQLVTPTPQGENTPIQDTQVVANLGYFQFRVAPGVFGLEIREGRGREIYTMESVGGSGWESPTVEEDGNEVALTSFEGVTLYPRLQRRPGMEKEDVLAEPADGDSGILENIATKVFGMFKKKDEVGLVPVKQQADINIFTVASGLLYERFASIMILSVLRNTNYTVKFWFIENFLSPSFLEFIPHMAAEYGFDYELVTYKWPSWLRAQSEKQRIIWAYKILFLDVLFPMDLKKVIFVDADQIVRADLKELVDLDLHGAPYGYTPMGDDNTDMEGFRFWKTGYWKNFLEGRPYHISALYVIDLVKFRQMAAGDILRQQYQALSADPNSLANLDQDLPNNLQQQVPIYSLHEDWLWCETWCSKDRLHKAKTIDLCQNPLTKEPKLSRARQIPEWEEYDTEIANLTRRLAEQGKISSGLSTADTNVLAGGSSGKKENTNEKAEESTSSEGSATKEERPRDEL